MEPLHFSFIIPVYNRPNEIDELLGTFTTLKFNNDFEIVIVEDGSEMDCKSVIEKYTSLLNIVYFFKPNSGPGDSRNYGMQRATGNYFIILDSDCLLPENYLITVRDNLSATFTDCYGGPDAAHASFSNLQKAINFSMTSFLTTGGIRGNKKTPQNFQPRSFNMGISKNAFEVSGGFGNIHPGEDPDLAIRLKKLGFKTKYIDEAYVYHKRRISWSKFYQQVYKFGLVRPILNHWHPETERLVFWFPTLFCFGLIVTLLLLIFGIIWPIVLYALYVGAVFFVAFFTSGHLIVAMQSVVAIFIQFFGYGYGFLKSTITLKSSSKSPNQQFPHLFFENGK